MYQQQPWELREQSAHQNAPIAETRLELREYDDPRLRGLVDIDKYIYECDVVFECQRGLVGFGGSAKFSASLLTALDPPPWCDETMSFARADIRSYPLPSPSWTWVSPHWRIDHSRGTDSEGWEYAGWFGNNTQWYSRPQPLRSYVRRRRWYRLRKCSRGPCPATANRPICDSDGGGGAVTTTITDGERMATATALSTGHPDRNAAPLPFSQLQKVVFNPNIRPHALQRAEVFYEPSPPPSNGAPAAATESSGEMPVPSPGIKVERKKSHIKRLAHRVHRASSSVGHHLHIHRTESHGSMFHPQRQRTKSSLEVPPPHGSSFALRRDTSEIDDIPISLLSERLSADQAAGRRGRMDSVIMTPASLCARNLAKATASQYMQPGTTYGETATSQRFDFSTQWSNPIDIDLVRATTVSLLDIINASLPNRERLAIVCEALAQEDYASVAVWHATRHIYFGCLTYSANRARFVGLLLESARAMHHTWLELCAFLALESMSDLIDIGQLLALGLGGNAEGEDSRGGAQSAQHSIGQVLSGPANTIQRRMAVKNSKNKPISLLELFPSIAFPTNPSKDIRASLDMLRRFHSSLAPRLQPSESSGDTNATKDQGDSGRGGRHSFTWTVDLVWKAILSPLIAQDDSSFFSDIKSLIPR
ncbi:hypothetical protein EV182_001135 [Spiromyces aspiralis]|uniref:Uncharacterized protein n=1 Tax=Spiromyces aspiralis TaxID=68401 RepID=A0ACC1HJE9_9FUNG|nr:hypothetical protein EV182_001135 [Spiromyces aspiralis]